MADVWTIPGLTVTSGSLPANNTIQFGTYGGGMGTPIKTVPQGSVLGASTGGGNVAPAPQTQQPTGGQPSGPSPQELYERQIRGEIEGGYNNYFSTLDQMMNTTLPAQQSAQLGIVKAQGEQATNTLGGQYTEGQRELAGQTTQTEAAGTKNLATLAEDVRNLFRAGQIYLGARGAGDSSATNQYSYAISKMGNVARGKVLEQVNAIKAQIQDKAFKLKNTYDTELRNIQSQIDERTNQIASWFASQQDALLQAKAQGQLQKSTDLANLSRDLLNQALSAATAVQTEAANKRLMLEEWAMNNSTTIGELQKTLAAIPGVAKAVSTQRLGGTITETGGGNLALKRPLGYYTGTEEEEV